MHFMYTVKFIHAFTGYENETDMQLSNKIQFTNKKFVYN